MQSSACERWQAEPLATFALFKSNRRNDRRVLPFVAAAVAQQRRRRDEHNVDRSVFAWRTQKLTQSLSLFLPNYCGL